MTRADNERNARAWANYWLAPDEQLLTSMQLEAGRLRRELAACIGLGETDVVLDFGAGTGHAAKELAAVAKSVFAYDQSRFMRDRIRQDLGFVPRLQVVDTIDDIPRPDSVTLVLVHSVSQYMAATELESLLTTVAGWQGARVSVVVSDILPETFSALRDLTSFLLAAVRHGFLQVFLRQVLARIASKTQAQVSLGSLTRYPYAMLEAMAHRSGFTCRRLPHNLGYSRARYSVLLTRAAPPPATR